MNDYTLTFHTVAYTTRLYIINAEFTFLSTASFAERMHLAVDSPPHKFLMLNASIFLSFSSLLSLSLSLSFLIFYLFYSSFQRTYSFKVHISHRVSMFEVDSFVKWLAASINLVVTSVPFVITRARVTRLHRCTRYVTNGRDY